MPRHAAKIAERENFLNENRAAAAARGIMRRWRNWKSNWRPSAKLSRPKWRRKKEKVRQGQLTPQAASLFVRFMRDESFRCNTFSARTARCGIFKTGDFSLEALCLPLKPLSSRPPRTRQKRLKFLSQLSRLPLLFWPPPLFRQASRRGAHSTSARSRFQPQPS